MYDMNSKYVPVIQTPILPLYPEDGDITFPCNVVTELLGYGVMFNRRKKNPALVSFIHTYQLILTFGIHAPIMIHPRAVYNTQPKAGVT